MANKVNILGDGAEIRLAMFVAELTRQCIAFFVTDYAFGNGYTVTITGY